MTSAHAPPRPPAPSPWLLAHLEAIGAIVEGATSRARAARCVGCRSWVLRGLTSPPMQVVAVVDPTPLSNLGEVQALAAGRVTFDVAKRAGRLLLEERDRWHILGSPADSPDSWRRCGDVVAGHECGGASFDSRPTRIKRF